MKSLSKTRREPGLWLTEVDKPDIGPNDVLIEITKMAICGTDMHIYNWDEWAQATIPVPMTIGHEYVGKVAAIGSEVRGFHIGDRVSGEGHITCGHCPNCRAGRRHLCRNSVGVGVHRPGAFAEYLALPAVNAFKLSDAIPDEVAVIFDPLGNAVHAALSFDLVGEDVLITGAGPIGTMAVALCTFVGARYVVITDVNPYRLELAKRFGATRAGDVSTDNLHALGMTEGFDVGLEMSGAPSAFNQMLATMNHGGKIALLGLPPKAMSTDWHQIIFKGLHLKGIYGREMFETWYKMANLVQAGLDIAGVITHTFSVDDYQTAFATLHSGESGKVVLEW